MNSKTIYDELGRPITLTSPSLTTAALPICLDSLNNLASLLATSYGPCGMDKMIVNTDSDITMTNDGATILSLIDKTNPIYTVIAELSKAQDDEIGDGTTGVVIIAHELMNQAVTLINRGMHPIRVIEGYERACQRVVDHWESISESLEINGKIDFDRMTEVVGTCLDSKIAKRKSVLGKICIEAVQEVADLERRDVDFELIKIDGKIGKNLEDSKLIRGVVIDKEFSHMQMAKQHSKAKIALLTCPFEMPKLKTKGVVNVKSAEEYRQLDSYEKESFKAMIQKLKDTGVTLVMCQWGFDDEANSLLMEAGIAAVRWVGGPELEMVAVHTGARIVARFEDLCESDLGMADVREESVGTEGEKVIVVENSDGNSKVVTILVRASNDMAVEEAKRCVRDALCAVRTIIKDPRILYGGGCAELSASAVLTDSADECSQAFARALRRVPMVLAENAGLDPYVSLDQENVWDGVDCLGKGRNMKDQGVIDPLMIKVSQIRMAVQMVSGLLKVDEMIYLSE